jgi:N-acetylglucosaminyldiphosphoundecaprenol N-acetyl-beta-D-mannosaminyltransferase
MNDVLPTAATLPATCDLFGMALARIDQRGVLDHMFAELGRGRGGWLITANLDFLRRHVRDPEARALYDAADLRVADGMPLVWAARVQGDELPERVAGSALVPLIAARAAQEGRSLYLLGGAPGACERAAEELARTYPGLRVCGTSSPRVGNPPSAAELGPIRDELTRLRPDILLVGLGSPKQEVLIRELRASMPGAWMIGVGISFSFIAGDVRRAPGWMQQTGLEWIYRLAQEPRRLARRYLVEDLPFSLLLLAHVLRQRGTRRRDG